MKIKITAPSPIVDIPMGGKDKAGNEYGVNSRYLTKNGKPILPIMGEFHFSRWTPSEWRQAILKMKAGGVEILATYVFWIHHEEDKGVWDFSGCRDIRAFLELCKELDMPVWLRIGPWAHGECRNGGFPDWLCKELGHNGLFEGESLDGIKHEARTNDPLYMKYVTLFWERLGKETEGMMAKDGGPVIGIQLENEYCHAGGPANKSVGREHMRALKELAIRCGFVTPYYTATGWGGAISIDGETLPVLGGYVDAPWAGHNHELEPSENFLFIPFHSDGNVGSDLGNDGDKGYTFSTDKNPYLTAELGAGLQIVSLRRTYPFPEDVEAQSLCMLGAGANLLGYYMYHGGLNPVGKHGFLQECTETGYFNNLPKRSYDFETCIRESGKLNESYFRLNKIHMLIRGVEDILAGSVCYLPDVLPDGPEDMSTPRVSVRYNHDTKEGFIFINNHQRLRRMEPIVGLNLEIELPDKTITVNDINCESGATAVIPFGLSMGECRLESTNAALLAKVGDRYYFYATSSKEPYFKYEGSAYHEVVVLSHEDANHAYVFGDKLYVTDRSMFEEEGELYMLTGEAEESVMVYETGVEGQVCEYLFPPEVETRVETAYKELGEGVYEIDMDVSKYSEEEDATDELNEIYLHIDFNGDCAELYAGDELLTDWLSNGEEWVVALKRYGYPTKLKLVVHPYVEGFYYDLPPKKGCGINHIFGESEYKILI